MSHHIYGVTGRRRLSFIQYPYKCSYVLLNCFQAEPVVTITEREAVSV